MLRLICGAAAPVMRRLLVDSFLEAKGGDGSVFIVPTEQTAKSLRRHWAQRAGSLLQGSVLSLEELSATIEQSVKSCVVSPAERLAIVRQVLLSAPARYEWLVGEKSAPHLTHGVLKRIADAMVRVTEKDLVAVETGEEDAAFETPRVHQLRQLGRVYQDRLESSGAVDARTAGRMSWSELTGARLLELLPQNQRIVLDGFDAFDEMSILAIRCLRDAASQVLLLLDYDPESDTESLSHFNSAYERLYDLADDVVLDPPAVDANDQSAQVATPLVIEAPTRSLEVEAIARHLRSEIDAAPSEQSFAYHDYTICFPAIGTYAPYIEQVFPRFGLPFVLESGQPLLQQPLWHLLDAFRNALATWASFTSLRELLKSRFLPVLITQYDAPGVETMELVQTLDRLRREEGVSSGGRQLILDLRRAIDRVGKELISYEERHAGSEDEHPKLPLLRAKLHEYRLLDHTLNAVLRFLKDAQNERALPQWEEYLSAVLTRCSENVTSPEAAATCDSSVAIQLPPRQRALHSETSLEIAAAMHRLVECGLLVTDASLDFSRLLGLLRVLLRGTSVPGQIEGEFGFPIRSDLPIHEERARVLVVGGLVDCEFPRYLAREARLEQDVVLSLDQKQTISRQRFQFQRAISTATERALLFVPRADSDGELLESQFVEELESQTPELARIASTEFLKNLGACSPSSDEVLDQLAAVLSTSSDAAQNFSAFEPNLVAGEREILGNIAYNIFANEERQHPDRLGNFDGFVSDPVLLKYLEQRSRQHVHSVSQLDVLVQCPFRYFLENVLEVRELQELEEGTAPRRAGELVHDILYRFYTEWVHTGHGCITSANRADAAALLATHAEAQLHGTSLTRFEQDSLAFRLYGSGGVAGLRGEVVVDAEPMHGVRNYPGILPAFLDLEVERAALAGELLLQPTYFELGFGLPIRHRESQDQYSTKAPIELTLPDGEKIRLRGRADRVDVAPGEFIIVDYKTGGIPTIKQQQEGYKVQIPVYLMALESIFRSRDEERQPVGGMFVGLTPKQASVEGQFFRKSKLAAAGIPRKRGLTDDDFDAALDLVRFRIADGLARIRQGRFHVTLAGEKIACTLCGSARICRKDLPRAERLVPQACAP